MTAPVFPARVPFTAPQISPVYDPQQMRTIVGGIARGIPPMVTRTVTANTKIAATDDTLLVDTTSGAVTVTLLPANQVQFLRVQIKNIGANTVVVNGTVDGAASPSLASLATLVIQSDGVAWRRLQVSNNNQTFDVRDYGAVGDDSHNDTSAIAAALSAAGVRGGSVLFPPGTYLNTAQQTVPSNVTLLGFGAASVIHAVGMSFLYVFFGSGVSYSTIDSLTITGTFATGIGIFGSNNVRIVNNDISGSTTAIVATGYGSAIFASTSEDVEIDNNYCHDNGTRTDDTRLFSDIQINGLATPGYARIYVTNNRCMSTNVHYNIQTYNHQDSEISGNIVTGAYCRTANNTGYGIMAYHSAPSVWSSVTAYTVGQYTSLVDGANLIVYVAIQNSTSQNPATSPTYWTLLDRPLRDVLIENNTVYDVEGPGIYCKQAIRPKVRRNTVRNTGTVMTEASLPSGGIGFNAGQGVSCTENMLVDWKNSGITFVTLPDGLIANNILIGTLAKSTIGIWPRGSSTGVKVEDNTIATVGDGIATTNTLHVQTACSFSGNLITSPSSTGLSVITAVGSTFTKNTIRFAGGHGLQVGNGAGSNNVVTNNNVTDSGQADGGTPAHANIYLQSPQITATGNVVGNTLSNGAKYGILMDSAAAPGSIVAANAGKDNRTADFSLPSGCAAGGNVSTANLGGFVMGNLASLAGSPTEVTQLQFGDSSVYGSIGSRQSGGDICIASNATQTTPGSDLWAQSSSGSKSKLIKISITGDMEFYSAVAGQASGTFAAFWGSAVITLGDGTFNGIKVGANQVISTRQAAVTAPTGGATIDAQARTAINAIIAVLGPSGHGLTA